MLHELRHLLPLQIIRQVRNDLRGELRSTIYCHDATSGIKIRGGTGIGTETGGRGFGQVEIMFKRWGAAVLLWSLGVIFVVDGEKMEVNDTALYGGGGKGYDILLNVFAHKLRQSLLGTYSLVLETGIVLIQALRALQHLRF